MVLWKFIKPRVIYAGVAELADATDLKSVGKKFPYRFDSGPRHQFYANRLMRLRIFAESFFVFDFAWKITTYRRISATMTIELFLQ